MEEFTASELNSDYHIQRDDEEGALPYLPVY